MKAAQRTWHRVVFTLRNGDLATRVETLDWLWRIAEWVEQGKSIYTKVEVM